VDVAEQDENDNSDLISRLFKRRKVQDLDDEIDSYLRIPVEDGGINPLEWWRTHTSSYPNLAKMAADYLCVVATSVPPEQVIIFEC
jgi:hypothetical protein